MQGTRAGGENKEVNKREYENMNKTTFGDKIKKILKDNGYSYRVKVYPIKEGVINRAGKKVFQNYEKVVIYAGRSIEKVAQKRSKRLVAWKNEKGEWEGDLETLKQFGDRTSDGNYTGSALYIRDYNDKTEPLKYVMFSDCDWNDDEEYAKNKMLKIMENWRFQEVERAKLDSDEDKAKAEEAREERQQNNL